MKPNKLSTVIIGFYTWIIAVFFGGILLDIAYSAFIEKYLSIPDRTATFSHIADILLAFSAVMVLAALGAIASSGSSRIARSLFIASLVVVIFEFITPVLLSQFVQGGQTFTYGPWIRIMLGGSASLLALTGLYTYSRQN